MLARRCVSRRRLCCAIRPVRDVGPTIYPNSRMFQPSNANYVAQPSQLHLAQQSNQQQQPPDDDEKLYRLLATRALLSAGMVYCFTEYVCDITLCEGPSMSPTIQPSGEIVLVEKFFCRRQGLEGGGSVGEQRAQMARKRQLEYETKYKKKDEWHQPFISISDKKPSTWRQAARHAMSALTVGDVVVVQHPQRKGTVCKRVLGLPGDQVLYKKLLVIPDGHLWIEGDNPANSADSRQYGAIPASLVSGRVLGRIWPLRGKAWMERGERPRQPYVHVGSPVEVSGSTVLPAGYEGQTIVKQQRT